jgi:tetratricopeptide (TPR) repeat protein
VHCAHCHKGVDGQPLNTYDFASDENPNKDRAREMLRMLKDINGHLAKIQPSGDKKVNVWCHTCHAGKARAITLEEDMSEQYRAKGIDAALQRYAELRKKYYGTNAYNFGENSLNGFGYLMLEKKDPAAAVKVFRLNTEQFPQSANVWDSLGEGQFNAGEFAASKKSYEKVLALEPKNKNAVEMLKKIADAQKAKK